MMNIPYNRIHISMTSIINRDIFGAEQWTIEAWRGEITASSNVFRRAPTLRAVKDIIDSMSEKEIQPSTEISIMMDGVMTSLKSDADWVLVILSELPDTFARPI